MQSVDTIPRVAWQWVVEWELPLKGDTLEQDWAGEVQGSVELGRV